MMVPEPSKVSPEIKFEQSAVAVCESILCTRNLPFMSVPKFGLDIAFLISSSTGVSIKVIEFKCYSGGRPDGVGFGTGGPQVDLLRHADQELEVVVPVIRWALVDALLPIGAKRYALFDSVTAKKSAMGEIRVGKHNNFRVSAFRPNMMDWAEFVTALEQFLIL